MRPSWLLLLALLPLTGTAQQVAPLPSGARLHTEDVARFWETWDAHDGHPDGAALQRGYLDPGSPGLSAFLRLRIGSAKNLAATIAAAHQYYASLRGIERGISAQQAEFTAAFERLEALYPPAVFPDVYFVIGSMNSAGTLAEEGLLIGLDMHGRQPGVDLSGLSAWHQSTLAKPQDLPRIVAHELIHYQQFNRSDAPTLLQQSITEGAADFLAERIAGSHINEPVHVWGMANECPLWREFSERMQGSELDGFLYDGKVVNGRPADLGYFIGYRIVDAYVARHGLSEQTLHAVLGGVDASTLLDTSGYAPCAVDKG